MFDVVCDGRYCGSEVNEARSRRVGIPVSDCRQKHHAQAVASPWLVPELVPCCLSCQPDHCAVASVCLL